MRKEWSMQTLRKRNVLRLIYVLCYSSLLGYSHGMGENIPNLWKRKGFWDMIFYLKIHNWNQLFSSLSRSKHLSLIQGLETMPYGSSG